METMTKANCQWIGCWMSLLFLAEENVIWDVVINQI